MIVSRGWDYVSELLPQTGLLLISQVIYVDGEPCWNNIGRGNLWFVHQSSLAVLSAESSSSKATRTGEEIINLALQSIFVHTSKGFLTCRKILRHKFDGFASSPKEGVLRILSPLKNIAIGRVWTRGPMGTTLNITSPRTISPLVSYLVNIFNTLVLYYETHILRILFEICPSPHLENTNSDRHLRSSFYGAFSVIRQYGVDDRVTSEWWGIRTSKVDSDRTAIVIGKIRHTNKSIAKFLWHRFSEFAWHMAKYYMTRGAKQLSFNNLIRFLFYL
jgi:hypothetical protein